MYFTFHNLVIDDIVDGVVATLLTERKEKSKYSLYNIGNSKPVRLMDFIEAIENTTGKKAHKQMYPMQAGDVAQTWADTSSLQSDFGYKPKENINQGVKKFVTWYKEYYK